MAIRPNRIGFDTTPEIKERIERQAKFRGYDNVKSYLISLIDKDRDIIALVGKAEKNTKK